MSYSLKDKLYLYKDVTLCIIDNLINDNYDKISNLISKRQNIIEEIDNMKFPKEDFTLIAQEIQIMKYESELQCLMNTKKSFLKEKIKEISLRKNANNIYNSGYYSKINFLNKKV